VKLSFLAVCWSCVAVLAGAEPRDRNLRESLLKDLDLSKVSHFVLAEELALDGEGIIDPEWKRLGQFTFGLELSSAKPVAFSDSQKCEFQRAVNTAESVTDQRVAPWAGGELTRFVAFDKANKPLWAGKLQSTTPGDVAIRQVFSAKAPYVLYAGPNRKSFYYEVQSEAFGKPMRRILKPDK
jgi:hypothetical protein